MDVGVTRFLRALTQFVMNVFLLFMIAGQLGMDSASIVAVLGAAGLGDALQNGFSAGVWLTSQGKILNATGAGTAKIYIRKKPKSRMHQASILRSASEGNRPLFRFRYEPLQD